MKIGGGGLIEGSVKPCQILYTATSQLTDSKYAVGAQFCGSQITAHTFSNGEGVITFAGEITALQYYSFQGCSSLTSINIPNSVTSIGAGAFGDCSSLTSITIPNSVTTIGDNAFSSCIGLTSITIPNSVTTIGIDAFWCCSSLTSITIPNSVTSIGGGAFNGCSSLTSITIPNSVTSIGGGAFNGCSNATITMEGITPPSLGSDGALKDVVKIIVPHGTLSTYQEAWSAYPQTLTKLEEAAA